MIFVFTILLCVGLVVVGILLTLERVRPEGAILLDWSRLPALLLGIPSEEAPPGAQIEFPLSAQGCQGSPAAVNSQFDPPAEGASANLRSA